MTKQFGSQRSTFGLGLRGRWVMGALLLVALLAGCRGALAPREMQPLVLGDVPWADGEQSSYRVTDVDGEYAGTATFTLYQVDGNWTLERIITAQGLQETLVVNTETDQLRPVLSVLTRDSEEGRQMVQAEYRRGEVEIELTSRTSAVTYEVINTPSDVRDQRTVLPMVRALPLANDYATRISTIYPIRGQQERVEVVVTGQEEVSVPAGTFNTWSVQLTTPRNRSQAWYSVEVPHTLVKFIDGDNEATYELSETAQSQ